MLSFLLLRRTDGNFRINPNVDFLSSEFERSNIRLPGGKGGCAHKLFRISDMMIKCSNKIHPFDSLTIYINTIHGPNKKKELHTIHALSNCLKLRQNVVVVKNSWKACA